MTPAPMLTPVQGSNQSWSNPFRCAQPCAASVTVRVGVGAHRRGRAVHGPWGWRWGWCWRALHELSRVAVVFVPSLQPIPNGLHPLRLSFPCGIGFRLAVHGNHSAVRPAALRVVDTVTDARELGLTPELLQVGAMLAPGRAEEAARRQHHEQGAAKESHLGRPFGLHGLTYGRTRPGNPEPCDGQTLRR